MRFFVELEAVGGGGWMAPPTVRVRKLLKAALRSHGLRCVRVSVEEPEGGDVVPNFAGNATPAESPLPSLAVAPEESRPGAAASGFLPPSEAL